MMVLSDWQFTDVLKRIPALAKSRELHKDVTPQRNIFVFRSPNLIMVWDAMLFNFQSMWCTNVPLLEFSTELSQNDSKLDAAFLNITFFLWVRWYVYHWLRHWFRSLARMCGTGEKAVKLCASALSRKKHEIDVMFEAIAFLRCGCGHTNEWLCIENRWRAAYLLEGFSGKHVCYVPCTPLDQRCGCLLTVHTFTGRFLNYFIQKKCGWLLCEVK